MRAPNRKVTTAVMHLHFLLRKHTHIYYTHTHPYVTAVVEARQWRAHTFFLFSSCLCRRVFIGKISHTLRER